jgi:hypothetical protein
MPKYASTICDSTVQDLIRFTHNFNNHFICELPLALIRSCIESYASGVVLLTDSNINSVVSVWLANMVLLV